MGYRRALDRIDRSAFEQLKVLHANYKGGPRWSSPLASVHKRAEGAAEAGLECLGLLCPSLLSRLRTRAIFGEDGVSLIEQRDQPLHEAGRHRVLSEPVVHPLTLPEPLDQSGVAEDLEVPRHPRLALPNRRSEIRHAEVTLTAQGNQSQPRRFAGGLQPGDELGRS
jgi:hypothetical protein